MTNSEESKAFYEFEIKELATLLYLSLSQGPSEAEAALGNEQYGLNQFQPEKAGKCSFGSKGDDICM